MDAIKSLSDKLGIIEILKSKKERIESNSNIDLKDCYKDIESFLRRIGFYGKGVGTTYVDRAFDEYSKGRKEACTFIDDLIFEISKIGLPDQSEANAPHININNSNQQSQQQQQNIALDLFLESIKDELTGKQLKEVRQIIKEEPNTNIAKNQIVNKLKEFGVSVLSNIVANIITNPNIITSF